MTPLAIIGEEVRGTAQEARQAAASARRRRAARGGHVRAHQLAARRAAMRVASAALEARDHGTSAHSEDVVVLCRAIADRLGIRGQERADLIAAARLHDVGKVAVPTEIIVKPGALDELEWATMRQHTVVGEEILSSVSELKGVAGIVRSCHERYDGTGYPDGLAGEEIPLAARVVFCADAFHAIREDRPYRKGRSAARALAEVRRNAGSQFDPLVVQALEEAAREVRQAGPDRLDQLSAPLRSRRLMALLLTLTIGGSTLAAAGLRLPNPFTGSDEPPAPATAGPDCGVDCVVDLGGLGRVPVPGARSGVAGAGGSAAGIAFGPGGVGFRSDGRGSDSADGGAQDPSAPAGGDGTGRQGETPSGSPGGEAGGPGSSGTPGGSGAAPGSGEAGTGAPGGSAPGDGGGGSESHDNTSDPIEQLLPSAPELPVELPELPVQLPQLPVELPALPVELPKLPKLLP